mmetsp:Transcript_158333/g.507800  ORF Transcript_158333/g.507800 Transcript_158333/m.507800 type:complete len:359 (-) Transcript_158333:3713-4789(-)
MHLRGALGIPALRDAPIPVVAAPHEDPALLRGDGGVRVGHGAVRHAVPAEGPEPARPVACLVLVAQGVAVAIAPGEDAAIHEDGRRGVARAFDLSHGAETFTLDEPGWRKPRQVRRQAPLDVPPGPLACALPVAQEVPVRTIGAGFVAPSVELPSRREGAAVEGTRNQSLDMHAPQFLPLVQLVRRALVSGEGAAGEHSRGGDANASFRSGLQPLARPLQAQDHVVQAEAHMKHTLSRRSPDITSLVNLTRTLHGSRVVEEATGQVQTPSVQAPTSCQGSTRIARQAAPLVEIASWRCRHRHHISQLVQPSRLSAIWCLLEVLQPRLAPKPSLAGFCDDEGGSISAMDVDDFSGDRKL